MSAVLFASKSSWPLNYHCGFRNTWLLIMMIPLFFLCTLKHLKSLGTFRYIICCFCIDCLSYCCLSYGGCSSIFADFANVFAYGIVYWFDFEHIHLVK